MYIKARIVDLIILHLFQILTLLKVKYRPTSVIYREGKRKSDLPLSTSGEFHFLTDD